MPRSADMAFLSEDVEFFYAISMKFRKQYLQHLLCYLNILYVKAFIEKLLFGLMEYLKMEKPQDHFEPGPTIDVSLTGLTFSPPQN